MNLDGSPLGASRRSFAPLARGDFAAVEAVFAESDVVDLPAIVAQALSSSQSNDSAPVRSSRSAPPRRGDYAAFDVALTSALAD